MQGRTVVKPLVGPGAGPSDAAIVEPVPGSGKGLAISQGLATGHMVAMAREHKASGDPYWMTLAAIDECVRNLVCVGADPSRVAILDNFCWPSCKKPENLGSLVRAAEGCYDGAKAYRTPFVSGKDSLNNQFTIPGEGGSPGRTIEIPPTLLITGVGIVPAIERAVTMDAKRAGNLLVLVGRTQEALAGSHLAMVAGGEGPAFERFPTTDLEQGPRVARQVHEAIRCGLVASAHDVSDGGLLCAVAEMLIAAAPASGDSSKRATVLGAELLSPETPIDPLSWAFGESPSRYVLEVAPGDAEALRRVMGGVACEIVGQLSEIGRLVWADAGVDEGVASLREAWTRPLDW
ncbi:MAG: AIR synthase-related protein [Phycisphaerales bacterium]